MEKKLLKDVLFHQEKIADLAKKIHLVYPQFRTDDFVVHVVNQFPYLELKARIVCIRKALKEFLPAPYPAALQILLAALPPPNNPNAGDDDFGDFIYAPFSDFVAAYGCQREYLDFSFVALREITMRFSAEDAIRAFLQDFLVETLVVLHTWILDNHYHVRRLCSEGTRPKLPWSRKITMPIEAAIPLLDALYGDKTRFVTRSVANHLNDISKINKDLALMTLQRWQSEGKQNPQEMTYIIRHALRGLVKAGDKTALQLLGVDALREVVVSEFKFSNIVQIGGKLEFSCCLSAQYAGKVVVDYTICFVNKNGKLGKGKVFKWKTFVLQERENTWIHKAHTMHANMTTRQLYEGSHPLWITVNGEKCAQGEFFLQASQNDHV